MLKLGLMAALAATLTAAQIAPAVAHGHGGDYGYLNYSGMLVDDEGEMDNEDDVVSVAEPAAHYEVVQTDSIVTPYGYTPYYQSGYYQGYGYNPQYAYNPYYAAAEYSPVDPVSAAVVSTVLNVAQGGRGDERDLIQALIGGLVASQLQQQYPPDYYPPQYTQPQYYTTQYYTPEYYAPQYYQPQYVPRDDEHRGWRHHEHGDDDHGD